MADAKNKKLETLQDLVDNWDKYEKMSFEELFTATGIGKNTLPHYKRELAKAGIVLEGGPDTRKPKNIFEQVKKQYG